MPDVGTSRVGAKVFAAPGASVDLPAFIPAFHGWIQRASLEGLTPEQLQSKLDKSSFNICWDGEQPWHDEPPFNANQTNTFSESPIAAPGKPFVARSRPPTSEVGDACTGFPVQSS